MNQDNTSIGSARLEAEKGHEGEGTAVTTTAPRRRRGFAAMDPQRQKEIAAKGGRASHASGRGHEWDREAARIAGRKGGLASRGGRRAQAAAGTTAATPAPQPAVTAESEEKKP